MPTNPPYKQLFSQAFRGRKAGTVTIEASLPPECFQTADNRLSEKTETVKLTLVRSADPQTKG
jgi:hypothetical protein